MPKVTIRDIARVSGFSRSTVSLVLNNSPHVSQDTRQRILQVINELDYHPSSAARTLAGRHPRTVGIVFPKVSHCFSDCYFSEALAGIADALLEHQYQMLVEFATPAYKQGTGYLDSFKANRVVGMLYVGAWDDDLYIREVKRAGCPVVLVNSRLEGVPSVVANNTSGAYRAVEHLVSLGHKRIGIISSPGNVTTSQDRLRGYKDALRDYGLLPPPELIVEGDFTEQSGSTAAQVLLDREPNLTAMLVANDMMAIGALGAVRSRGRRVPEDLSIVGADDIRLASYVQPPLTTIRQPIFQIGQLALEQLLAMINGEQPEKLDLVVPTEFIARRSTAPVRITAQLVTL